MGILEQGSGIANGLANQSSIGGQRNPTPYGEDFPEGLVFVEIIKGEEVVDTIVQLAGRFIPQVPFELGGTQAMAKEYYPGNPEPTVQVLGARENNIPIKGSFKTSKFKDLSLRSAAEAYQQSIDDMRKRGNLIKLTLGEYKRYGFIEGAKFKVNTLQNIEYDIDFFVVGVNPPTLDKTVNGDSSVNSPNNEVIAAAAQALLNSQNYPDSMPTSFKDTIDGAISGVAEKVNLVTNFVTGIIADAQGIVQSANRAIGLIKNARATISKATRDINFLAKDVSGLANLAKNEAEKLEFQIKNISHIQQVQRDYTSLAALLASLQSRFAALSLTVPMVRHLVRQGDSLQTLAQKYYRDSTLWNKIYKHNKLSSTTLVVGSVLEIPKL